MMVDGQNNLCLNKRLIKFFFIVEMQRISFRHKDAWDF